MKFNSADDVLLEMRKRIESTIDDLEGEIICLRSALYEVDNMLKAVRNEN